MRRRAAQAALGIGGGLLLWLAVLGAVGLDERYRAVRFRPSTTGGCPLVVSRPYAGPEIVEPMCTARQGW